MDELEGYRGVHAFVFLPLEPDPAPVIEQINGRWKTAPDGPVVFGGLFEKEGSDFGGIVHLAAGTGDELGELLDRDLWELGVRSDTEAEGRVYRDGGNRTRGPRRGSPAFNALCRIRVARARPGDVLQRVGDRWDGKPPFIGGSQLFRRSQLLVQLGDEDREALMGHVAELRAILGETATRFEVGIGGL